MISPLFDPNVWSAVDAFELTDITYHRHRTLGVVRIAFNRPRCRNAFRPHAVDELYRVLDPRQWSDVGCVLLTDGPSTKDGGWGCSRRRPAHRGDPYYEDAGSPGRPSALGTLHIPRCSA